MAEAADHEADLRAAVDKVLAQHPTGSVDTALVGELWRAAESLGFRFPADGPCLPWALDRLGLRMPAPRQVTVDPVAEPPLEERAARAVCAHTIGGFCQFVGGDLGCLNGRGVAPNWRNCIADRVQLSLSGTSRVSEAVLGLVDQGQPGEDVAGLIDQLRQSEGAAVTILCDNPEFFGPNNAIEVIADWTNWQTVRFSGESLVEALRAALSGRGGTVMADASSSLFAGPDAPADAGSIMHRPGMTRDDLAACCAANASAMHHGNLRELLDDVATTLAAAPDEQDEGGAAG